MLKILLILFTLTWVVVLTLVIGETYAMEDKYPRFTAWWRKHVIGKEK